MNNFINLKLRSQDPDKYLRWRALYNSERPKAAKYCCKALILYISGVLASPLHTGQHRLPHLSNLVAPETKCVK